MTGARRWGLLLLTLAALAQPAKAASDKFYVPPTQFSGHYQITAAKDGEKPADSVSGAFRGGTGSFAYDAEEKNLNRLRFAIDANRSPFAMDYYPEITFVAASAKFSEGKAEVKGTLTIHGVSHPTRFDATLNPIDGDNEKSVSLSLRGDFKLADFGLSGDASLSRLGESATLLLDVQAIKQ